jgi:predicted metal-dependent HD superfamily phosphohydrolase
MEEKRFERLMQSVSDAGRYLREQKLKERWYNFCSEHGLPPEWSTGVYYLMQKFYQLPLGLRHYHTLHGHIYDCLEELDKFKKEYPYFTDEWFETEFVMWIHDIFYVALSDYNEAESANLGGSLVFGTPFSAQRIKYGVIATKTALPPRNYVHESEPELELICDLDLVGMGGSYEQFVDNGLLIRKEFAEVPDDAFAVGRKKFFEELYKRGYVYRLPYFKDRYEKRARENIKRFIES